MKAKLTPQQRYNRLWRKVDQNFGANGVAPPPMVSSRGTGHASTDGTTVSLSPKLSRQLTSRKPSVRRDARFVLLHEWSHVKKGTGEGMANHDANVISRGLNKQQRRNQKLAAIERARKRKRIT